MRSKCALVAILMTLSALTFNLPAQAASIYNCQLSGTMQGASVAVFLGGQIISGPGYLSCTDSARRHYTIPVKLSLLGGGVGFDVSIIRAMTVRSSSIRLANPEMVFRSFGLGATAGATLVNAGIAFNVAARVTDNAGLDFEVGFSGQDAIGLGGHLYAMGFSIERR